MFRRHFVQKTALTLLASIFSAPAAKSAGTDITAHIKPPRLRDGATVALIAPASPASDEKIAKALANLTAFGYQVREGSALRARHGYLAGEDAARLADLHWAFSDPDVDAVWCVRGGYGATRLLPYIDYNLLRKNPKPFIGYSDVTALHLAISQQTGLVTFHGPVAASDFPENTLQHLRAVVASPQPGYRIQAPDAGAELPGAEYQPFTITPGTTRGRLTGGNLSLLATLAGTAFQPSFDGKIVFIEDVGEQPYRIDRLLTQLLQATDLRKAAGIVLGVFAECGPKNAEFSLTLPETLTDRLGNLGMPVAYGLPFGHVAHQATFPYQIEAQLDADNRTLILLESGIE
ncbi:MAG: LD-carboxypeptidase [Lewinellaceae bacterium]|nr:LD-carboxypeptidase [Lewinellaceae bacterium]